ncbi:hypothetical protein AAVH_28796, partial [Aphelenchoides avenae]
MGLGPRTTGPKNRDNRNTARVRGASAGVGDRRGGGTLVLLMAFPLCETSLSKLLVDGGGRLPKAYKPFLKLWFVQSATTIGDMHGSKVIHGDLHPGNILFEKVDGYLRPM